MQWCWKFSNIIFILKKIKILPLIYFKSKREFYINYLFCINKYTDNPNAHIAMKIFNLRSGNNKIILGPI